MAHLGLRRPSAASPPIVHASNFCQNRVVSMTKDGVSLTKEMFSLVKEKVSLVVENFLMVMEMAPTPLVKSHPVKIFVGLNLHNTLKTNIFSQSYLNLLLPPYSFPRPARAQPVG